eukprot:2372276-Alexandrium_andersonii.AAC.1
MLDGFYTRVRDRWGAATPEALAQALAQSAAWPARCPRVLSPFEYIPPRVQEEVADSLEWAAIQAVIVEAAFAAFGQRQAAAPAAPGAPILRSLQAAARPPTAAEPIDVDV